MNASISVVCYRSKVLSCGENPIMLQISKNGKRKYQSTGLSVNPISGDFTKNKPKPNCPNGDYIQKIILDKIVEFQKLILKFNANQKEYTLTSLLESNESSVKDKTVGEFYQELILNFVRHNGVICLMYSFLNSCTILSFSPSLFSI